MSAERVTHRPRRPRLRTVGPRDYNTRMAHAQRIDTAVERYRLFVESSPLIPWEADAQTWQFTYVGPQAEDVLGSRVVEEVEIVAVPDRIGSEVQRSASR